MVIIVILKIFQAWFQAKLALVNHMFLDEMTANMWEKKKKKMIKFKIKIIKE
jgi:hypothetical protein